MGANIEDIIYQAMYKPEGTYVFKDGKLIPFKEEQDDEIPFCDEDCSGCCECELDEDFDEEEPICWGIPDIEYIIFNPPATIVFWSDGTKTVVKAMEGEKYEKYAGFAMACMKKMFGSTSRAKAIMRDCDEEEINAQIEAMKAASKNVKQKKSVIKSSEGKDNETPAE